jgi:hypothetical protein
MAGCDQLHLVLGIILNQRENNRPFHLSGDQHRIAHGAAEGRLLGGDFDALYRLEVFKKSEIFGLSDLQVEGPGTGVYGELGCKLALYPGDLGEIRCNPDAVDDLTPDLNWTFLSFSRRFSTSCCPSG